MMEQIAKKPLAGLLNVVGIGGAVLVMVVYLLIGSQSGTAGTNNESGGGGCVDHTEKIDDLDKRMRIIEMHIVKIGTQLGVQGFPPEIGDD
ncbi:MAG: hypothetical protein ACYTBJ_16365 [Planctomycetota bacterium]|jgi:hypothetical protein